MSLDFSGISWTDGTLNSLYGHSACSLGCGIHFMRLTNQFSNLPHDAVPIEVVLKDIRGLDLNRAVVVRGKLCFRTALSSSLLATSLS